MLATAMHSLFGAAAWARRSPILCPDPLTLAPPPSHQVPFEPASVADIRSSTASAPTSGLVVVACTEGDVADGSPSGALAAFDTGDITTLVARHAFKAAKGSSVTIGPNLVLVGLGSGKDAIDSRALGKSVATIAKTNKCDTVSLAVTIDAVSINAGELSHGILTGAYESTRFKTKKDDAPEPFALTAVDLLFKADAAAISAGSALAKGVFLTKYLVEAPPNVCTPTHMAECAAHISSISDRMSLTVHEKQFCEEEGMGLYLGVAECSAEAPKFIHLIYRGPNAKRKFAIVGKGLTFDSGGYNIKSAASMIEMMKFDMGGAGATLGCARAIAEMQPDDVEVHFIIASCENMVDGKGLRPGDILVASNGKTVEVNNTDAEGRLTLADALLYAQKHTEAETIVDIATLTGACMVALGPEVSGMYSPEEEVVAAMKNASKSSGDKVWHMPLEDAYLEQLKSPIADYKNTGGRLGGSITAALFLKEFVDTEKVHWSHLDIAGPCWDDKQGGATGHGAALLTDFVLTYTKK